MFLHEVSNNFSNTIYHIEVRVIQISGFGILILVDLVGEIFVGEIFVGEPLNSLDFIFKQRSNVFDRSFCRNQALQGNSLCGAYCISASLKARVTSGRSNWPQMMSVSSSTIQFPHLVGCTCS